MRMAWITLPQPRRNKPWPSCPRRQVFLRLPHRRHPSSLHSGGQIGSCGRGRLARALFIASFRAHSPHGIKHSIRQVHRSRYFATCTEESPSRPEAPGPPESSWPSRPQQGLTPLKHQGSRAGKWSGQPVSCDIRLYGAFPGGMRTLARRVRSDGTLSTRKNTGGRATARFSSLTSQLYCACGGSDTRPA